MIMRVVFLGLSFMILAASARAEAVTDVELLAAYCLGAEHAAEAPTQQFLAQYCAPASVKTDAQACESERQAITIHRGNEEKLTAYIRAKIPTLADWTPIAVAKRSGESDQEVINNFFVTRTLQDTMACAKLPAGQSLVCTLRQMQGEPAVWFSYQSVERCRAVFQSLPF